MSNSAQNVDPRPRRGSNADTKCPKCEQMVVLRRDNPIQCKLCDSTWHKECVDNMDDDTYRVLKKNEKKSTPSLYWFCTKQCDKAAGKFLSGMSYLETQIKITNSKVEEIEKSVSDVKEGIFPERMEEKVRAIANDVMEKSGPGRMKYSEAVTHVNKVQEIIEQEQKDQMAEIEDRLRRKCNLVIFKLPETENRVENESEGDRKMNSKEEDKKQIETMFKEVGANQVPNDMRRLGKYNKDSPKPRPVRLSFNSEKERDEVLTLAYKSNKNKKDDDGKLCNKVVWRKDLTVKEREEEDQLYTELKNKRKESKDSGDDRAHWVRRRGQIVNIGDYRTPEEVNHQGDRGEEEEEGAAQAELK